MLKANKVLTSIAIILFALILVATCFCFTSNVAYAQNTSLVIDLNETSSFTSYTKDGFDIDMQYRLRDVCDELDSKGIYFLLSNSDTKLVNEMYKKYNIKKVFASRQINANAEGRGKITEVLVRNY